ncbi:MAG: ribosome small subunit-dependent GTPase A [Candidatus Saccharimonadaceae bacterium]
MNNLTKFGWTKKNQIAWDVLNLEGLQPARVVADFGTSLKLASDEIITAELSGKLAHYSNSDDTPKVGDWVAVRVLDNSAVIESVVLRLNEIARKVAGKRVVKQILAANVDIAFVLVALDNDFSVERLKRFLFQLSVHKIETVIVLNKADKTDDVQSYIDQLTLFDVPIIISVATDTSSADEIAAFIKPGQTAILLGSSGVGKSTLTNKLLGRHAQNTGAVRLSDSTGRHTTVHRELFILPNGGILIDTPGIRELQLWGTEEDLDASFHDIIELAAKCKYPNCQHTDEKRCAIHKALATGMLEKNHYANYLKMKAEIESLDKKKTERIKQENGRTNKDSLKNRSSKNYQFFDEED